MLNIITIVLIASFGIFVPPPKLDVLMVSWFDIVIFVIITLVVITWNAGIKGIGVINGIFFINLVPIITIYQGFDFIY